MKRLVLSLLCALLLCGCSAKPQEMSGEEIARLKAYQFPDPPAVQTVIDSEPLLEAFGSVAQGIQVIERNINGWHKVQLIYDYPGGKPQNWKSMCDALAAGTAAYKERTTAELVTPRGALLASSIGGKLTYDAFAHIQEPRHGFEHSEDLSSLDNAPYYVSSKNAFYHTDGTCGAFLSRVYYEVGVNDAVNERRYFCPICATEIRDEIKQVERTVVPFEFPVREQEPETFEPLDLPDYGDWDDEFVWISYTGSKYHSTKYCSNMNTNRAKLILLSEARARGRTRCSKCW